MTPTRRARRLLAPWWTVALLALVALVDRDGCLLRAGGAGGVSQAAFFSLILSGLSWLADVATASLEVIVSWLVTAVGWLSGRVASILSGTGAIFAKAWDALRIVWSDALRPALLWLDDKLKGLYSWLKSTFKPVFDFLDQIRQRLNDFYSRFIRPIIDTIDFIKAINQALLAFHINVLQGLDQWLSELERKIEEPFLWIYQKLNEITGWVNKIVTLDGFLQRAMLIPSMGRYAPAWMRIATNSRDQGLSGAGAEALQRFGEVQSQPQLVADMVAYLNGDKNDVGDVLDAAIARALDVLNAPPGEPTASA